MVSVGLSPVICRSWYTAMNRSRQAIRMRYVIRFERGDVLVEGNNNISGVIKYLTQSTWSHSALYVGPMAGSMTKDGEPHVLIEANVGEGVVSAPLSKYFQFHTRICRPVGLTEPNCAAVCAYAIGRIGVAYDLKNIIDLMRYLLPLPVPQRWRRRLIALGSGDPSRLICSALIAEAFRAVHYPILPKTRLTRSRQALEQLLEIRHSSLYCPRDFDISPYFNVVKPTIARGFNYKTLPWADLPQADEPDSARLPQLVDEVQVPLVPPVATADEKTTVMAA